MFGGARLTSWGLAPEPSTPTGVGTGQLMAAGSPGGHARMLLQDGWGRVGSLRHHSLEHKKLSPGLPMKGQ